MNSVYVVIDFSVKEAWKVYLISTLVLQHSTREDTIETVWYSKGESVWL